MPRRVSELQAWDSIREHTLLAMNELVRGNIENAEQVQYHLREAEQLLEAIEDE